MGLFFSSSSYCKICREKKFPLMMDGQRGKAFWGGVDEIWGE